MKAQSAEGIASLARLVHRQVPAPTAAATEELITRMEDRQARLDASGALVLVSGRIRWRGTRGRR
jgi:hypothetical protein